MAFLRESLQSLVERRNQARSEYELEEGLVERGAYGPWGQFPSMSFLPGQDYTLWQQLERKIDRRVKGRWGWKNGLRRIFGRPQRETPPFVRVT